MRLSANARSSGTAGLRWWQTISMSRCSSRVLTVYGRVGLVDDGSTLGCAGDGDDVRRVPAAGALGVVRVDRPAGDRREGVLDEAGLVERVGVDRDLHAGRVGHPQAGVDRRRRGAPVLVQLEAAGAGRAAAPTAPPRETVLPLPSSSTLTGQGSIASSIRARCQAPGVTVVALVPSAGPVPPPMIVVMPEASASSRSCGQMRWTWQSIAPAVRILPVAGDDLGGRADDQVGVDAVHGVGVAGLAERDDPAVADADVGLDDAPVVEDDRAGDDRVRRALGAGGPATGPSTRGSPCRRRRRPRRRRRAAVLLDLDQQVGVGEPDPVAGRSGRRGRRSGGGPARSRGGVRSAVVERAGALAAQARHDPVAGERHQVDLAAMPGSKRTAVPAGTASRCPQAAVAVELAAPGWPRRSGSASRPGPAGRRC